MDEAVLQSIIGTDKRNPYLQVCRRNRSTNIIAAAIVTRYGMIFLIHLDYIYRRRHFVQYLQPARQDQAGVLFFSGWLSRLDLLHCGTLLKQWLALVLLEAINIEQSKYVN